MTDVDLPFRVEYSKSNRASCKVCKNPIAKDVIRIACVVQSPFHDGKMERWHHEKCFFQKQRPKTEGDIAHFDGIRWEDQERLRKQIAEASNGGTAAPAASSSGKGRKRGKAAAAGGANKDFRVEYAKSSRSTCCGCQEKIIKEEVRISKKDFESEDARKYGGLDRWYHVECFAKLRSELGFFDTGANILGADALTDEDKKTLLNALPKIKEEDGPTSAKKIKDEPIDEKEEKALQKQNKEFFKLRDQLDGLTKSIHTQLLEYNGQLVPVGTMEVKDALTDAMMFGALEPCSKCGGSFMYQSNVGYKCTGSVNEWVLCENVTHNPKRKKFVVPDNLKEENAFLAKYKGKVKQRLFKKVAPSVSLAVKKEDETDGPKIQGKPKPLKHLDFVITPKTKLSKDHLKKEILMLGGNVKTKVTRETAAVISTPEQVEKMPVVIQDAQDFDIHVVSEDFVEEAKEFHDTPFTLIKKKSIAPWGGDAQARVSKSVAMKSASVGKSKYVKSSGTVKLTVKGGGAVDPDSGLSDVAHVYQKGNEKFTTVLGITDIQTKKNSFYKLQILKHDSRKEYWLFRSWGRIGTTIGGNKVDKLSLEECIQQFEDLYQEKSGNSWLLRDKFVKVPGKLYPIDIDDGTTEDTLDLLESNVESKLKKPVQDLIRLIFDVNTMKKAMLEYEIDMDKMPLGKISKNQIQQAYTVLTDLLNLVKSGSTERAKFIEGSNKFYTFIPHNFGVNEPTIIETEKEIQTKSEMLESLLEMEIAYNLLHTKTDSEKNALDAHYELLKTDIDVLDKESEEFKLIQKYVTNTHAQTHTQYDLIIEEVFVVKREGEERRYKPFKKLHNRKLLWHGSRVTNYAGILSQGLRIAPPEAPCTGYMFGKGIYFADMVSKSANYCCTNTQSPTGLLLLCDVALGNMYECYHADYVTKLPHGTHSTWGRGQTQPDPTQSVKLKKGVEVPCGPGIPADLKQSSSLLYNEFIVYDVAQVKVDYLVKMNFKYKY
ncbi:poly [ADP-ribose] polymerase [Copidosoma floridanum]|uniref:poly [ADP-ribose] polymerase n=1 Tax=Copidosoma floridanum TaxID=29053 RepID=UPI0006C9C538|nr:poly [ADP-ribose] polymerase [Copidosoma floridanum]